MVLFRAKWQVSKVRDPERHSKLLMPKAEAGSPVCRKTLLVSTMDFHLEEIMQRLNPPQEIRPWSSRKFLIEKVSQR